MPLTKKYWIIRKFNNAPFTFPDAKGVDQIVSWGRLDLVPAQDKVGTLIPTAREMVETTQAVFDQIALNPDILVGEEIIEVKPDAIP